MAEDRAADLTRLHNLDAEEQRAFWVRSACNMWGGREKQRPCPLQRPHPEHSYRYDSTPDNIIYWCKGLG